MSGRLPVRWMLCVSVAHAALAGQIRLVSPTRAAVQFGGMTWHHSDDPSRLRLNASGQLEWKPKKPQQIVAHFPARRLEKAGDVVEIALLWRSEGETASTDFDDNIAMTAGTGDFRLGIFDSGGTRVHRDGGGPDQAIFKEYKGYQARFSPNVPKTDKRFRDKTGEVHKPGMLLKRVKSSEVLLSNTNSYKSFFNTRGWGLPPGEFGPFRLVLKRTSRNTVEFSITIGEATYKATDKDSSRQPRRIDTLAIQFPNARPYSLVTVALPGKKTDAVAPRPADAAKPVLPAPRASATGKGLRLKVDLALPTSDKDPAPLRGTLKPGWQPFVAPRWADMYMHDAVWEDGTGGAPPATRGIGGTGVHVKIDCGGAGNGGFHVYGMARRGLGGGGRPAGRPKGDPIANGWFHNVDWGGRRTGDILMRINGLPAGEYELTCYHNHWEPKKQKTRNRLDQPSRMPNLPLVRAMPLPHAPLPGYKGWDIGLGTGKGVTSIRDARSIDVTSVTSDEKVATSVIRFRTDGSNDVLVIIDGGDDRYPDPARPGREGSKAVLNAFCLEQVK
jgi:hypothetical protein